MLNLGITAHITNKLHPYISSSAESDSQSKDGLLQQPHNGGSAGGHEDADAEELVPGQVAGAEGAAQTGQQERHEPDHPLGGRQAA